MGKSLPVLTILILWLSVPSGAGGGQIARSRIEAGDIGNRVEVAGTFGMPLGRWLTLDGVRPGAMPGKGGMHRTLGNQLRVTRVNGKALDRSAFITIDNVDRIPVDTPCTFSGYETGGMVGMPEDALLHTGHRKPAANAAVLWGWRFEVRFVVVKVVRPASVHAWRRE